MKNNSRKYKEVADKYRSGRLFLVLHDYLMGTERGVVNMTSWIVGCWKRRGYLAETPGLALSEMAVGNGRNSEIRYIWV